MNILKVLFLSSMLLLGCANCGQSDPVIPIPTDIDQCSAACDKMKSLKCEEGDDIVTPLTSDGRCSQGLPDDGPDGSIICLTTCKEFCQQTMQKGVFLEPKCIVEKVVVCSDIEEKCSANPH
jgi:hypothetical protein